MIFLIFLSGCSLNNENINTNLIKKDFKYKTFALEDRYIMFALEYLRQGNNEEASDLFLKLFENTLKEQYLLEYTKLAFGLKRYDELISYVQKNKNTLDENKNQILKVYILALIQKSELDLAEKEIKNLLKVENEESTNELLGNVYIKKAEYKKAKEIYKKLYKNSSSMSSLLNLSNVMYQFTDEKKEAINLLESYVNVKGCGNIVCSKLLEFYQNDNNIDGVISILKRTYLTFKDEENSQMLDKIYKLLMFYLEKKDINEAIFFLEESGADDNKLLSLYRVTNNYKKANKLVNKLYKDTGNIDYLAQIAIIEFEMAKDKKKVLKSVIKKFEDVLTILDNHVYQNYLGYILIDFDIDVEKGLYYVNKALEKAPDNLAYIDSLAWGLYKQKDCKNAYINMKRVVESTGTNDNEIKLHWEKIKECNK
ncbi:hypothetical protein [Halarcobacter sp.]|uniref:tetratricopeptide repeat protein n=1 Tax=Halarcobacter sp. TaxID=2321133 RepID=UPI0029F53715|nr:hypothetical protein [Halarcobacter sp.]